MVSQNPIYVDLDCVYMCVGAVIRLLLSEKSKCNVAIWAKIKVRSLCMYLFTIEQ